jgi:ABC-type bacteriocin/lantibiotic exporter with double-glycine peptidase domain
MTQSIDLQKIIINSLRDNKILGVSMLILLAGYWFQDVLFSKIFGKVLADIPNFVSDISFSKILAIIFPYMIAHFLFYIDDMIQAKHIPSIELSIVNELIDKVFESVKTTKKQVNVNELVLNLKNVLDIKNIYALITTYIIPTVLICFAVLYYFMIADIKYGLIAIVIIIIFIAITLKFEKDCVDVTKTHEESVGVLYDEIQDVMINNDTILTFNTKDKEIDRMKYIIDDCVNKHSRSEIKSCEVTLQLNVISMIMMLCIDALAVKMYMNGVIEEDSLIAICIMTYTFIKYYNSVVVKIKNVIHYLGKYEELKKYFSAFTIEENKNEECIQVTEGKISFQNVHVIHDDKIMPLRLNFEIEGGSRTSIIGEIGTGKTSILKILAGLKKYSGDVYIDGQNIKNCTYESLMKYVMYIPQHPKLFNRTIYENLSYGTILTKKYIKNVIKKYKIEKFFEKFPEGIMANVGKEGNKLSGGQKQIMALIRAIIQKKKIILLDEPTSSLDTDTKDIFISLIQQMKGTTILVVTHDKSIDDIFDDTINLKHG